jgi:hypothetical protein
LFCYQRIEAGAAVGHDEQPVAGRVDRTQNPVAIVWNSAQILANHRAESFCQRRRRDRAQLHPLLELDEKMAPGRGQGRDVVDLACGLRSDRRHQARGNPGFWQLLLA